MTLGDKSDTTENFRLEALASLPDLAVKEKVWTEITSN